MMNLEAQRIALATACPTVFVRPLGQSGWNYVSSIAGRVLPCIDGDMLKDLNAMHAALQSQSNQFRLKFEGLMDNYCAGTGKLWCELAAKDFADIFLQVERT